MAKFYGHTHDKRGRRYSSKKRRYTDAQRAAYWKKKYLDLLKEMKGWV